MTDDTLNLARLIASEVDAEMHRKGYEQGLIDGAKNERQICIAICNVMAAPECAAAIMRRDSE
jgi:hypothetical protein